MSLDALQEENAALRQRIAALEKASLLQNQMLLQGVLEHTPSAISVRDREGHFLFINRHLELLIGRSCEHIVGKHPAELFPPELVRTWQETDLHVLASGQPFHLEESGSIDGRTCTFISSKFPIHDDEGQIYAIGVISTDITERKQIEDAIHQSEQRYREITTLISDAVYSLRIEPDGSFVHEWGAETFSKITGYEPHEFDLNTWGNLLHPDDVPIMLERLERFQQHLSAVSEYRVITKSGEVRWLCDHGQPVWSEDENRLVRIYGAVQDITEQKNVEHALQRANRAYRTLSECNQAVVRASDEPSLLHSVCQAIVEVGGYRLAWVGLAEHDDAKTIRPVAKVGEDGGYLTQLQFSWDMSGQGGQTAGEAIRSGQAQVIQHIVQDPRYAQWKDEAKRLNIASTVFLPLIYDDVVLGILNIYAQEPDAFDAKEMDLMMELAGDLAYGIAALRRREEHERAERELAVYREQLEELVEQRTNELQQSEESLRSLLNAIQEAALLVDTEGTILQANQTAAQRLGCKLEQFLGTNSYDHIPPEIATTRRKKIEQVIREGRPVRFEDIRNGRYIDNTVYPVVEPTGTINRLAVFAFDRTEHKQTQEAYRNLVEHSIQGLIVLQDNRIVFANPAMVTIHGYTPEELLAMSPTEVMLLIHPEDRPIIEQRVKDRIIGKNVGPYYEHRIIRKDGQIRWVAVYAAFVQYRHKPASQLAFLDITERKQAEEALRQSQMLLQGIVDHAPAIISVCDVQERYLLVNQRLVDTLGFTHTDEVIGKTMYDFFEPTMCALVHADNEKILASGLALSNEYQASDVHDTCTFLTNRFPIYNVQGNLYAIGSISTDITERKQTEERIHALNETLERRAAELEMVNAELESFSYSVAHDLRSPLWTIDLIGETLQEEYSDCLHEEAQAYVQRIRSNAQHMAHLIDDLLKLSQITRSELQMTTVNLSVLANEIVTSLRQRTPERSVDVVIAPNITIKGDARLLRIVLENLLSNAWKFTSKQAHAYIEVGVLEQAGEHIYFVRDNGVGFAMESAPKLFGAFQRLHDKKEFPGMGIGLATVRRIIQRHGGHVFAQGTPGNGATFYFTNTRSVKTVCGL